MHPLLKRYFPGLFYLEKSRRGRHLQGLSTEQVFTRIYHNHYWLQLCRYRQSRGQLAPRFEALGRVPR